MNHRQESVRGWWGVGLLLAAALSLRADVLILKNGALLLGRPTATTADSVSLAIGAAGTASVRRADIRQTIACPPAEEPDSYLKAAQRAGHAGWFAEAFACCDKSIAVEPATAAAAQSLRAALQQSVLAGARTRTPTAGLPVSDSDRHRAEAQKLIAEGEQMLRAAQLAANFDARNRGSSARAIQQQGLENVKTAQAKIDEGRAMLEKAEKAMAPPPPPPPPSTLEQITQWGWLIGLGAVGLVVLWFVLSPFLPRR
ncbi:MAG: hypothetical protein HZC54_16005 [Verrucomicrobia bacterium]|nr:hypothetical protein [Verrucomicrobiota bacterium]